MKILLKYIAWGELVININYTDTLSYLNRKSYEEFEKDRSLQSSLALKRLVKPIFVFAENIEAPTWFYVTPRRDYLIIPGLYCSCKNFIINVMSRKNKYVCKHLVIQYIGSRKNMYRIVKLSDLDTYLNIIREILSINISPTLRKLLY